MLADFLKDYLPIILFLVIALGLSMAFVAINYLASPKNPDPEQNFIHNQFFQISLQMDKHVWMTVHSEVIHIPGVMSKTLGVIVPQHHFWNFYPDFIARDWFNHQRC